MTLKLFGIDFVAAMIALYSDSGIFSTPRRTKMNLYVCLLIQRSWVRIFSRELAIC